MRAESKNLAGYISIGLYTYIMFNGERLNDVASILICFLYYCLHSNITVELIRSFEIATIIITATIIINIISPELMKTGKIFCAPNTLPHMSIVHTKRNQL